MMCFRLSSFAFGVALSLSLFACGDDDGTMDSGPSDGGMDAMADTLVLDTSMPDVPVQDVPVADTSVPGDSFDTAVEITIDAEEPTMEAIEAPGDVDYYTFEGTEGQWLAILTGANPDDDDMMVDTVITLYDSSRTRIAENDDAQPRTNTDSELITRLPSTGTYYIEVQEFSSWDGSAEPEGQPDFEYQLAIAEIDPDNAAVTVDAEAGDDAATAPTFAWTAAGGQLILGTYRDDADVDVLRFAVDGGRQSLSVNIMPQGEEGYGSTTATGDVWITSAEAPEVIIARVDGAGDRSLNPSLDAGDYLLWVDHPGAAGSNDFYVLKAGLGVENTLEAEVDAGGTNDTLATAEALTLMDDGMGTLSGFVLSMLPTDDIDYRSFDVAADQEVTIVCASSRGGSGVQGLTASLHDDTDTLRPGATGVESTTAAIRIVETSPPAGTYYLRLEKTGQDAVVTGDWARCGIFVGPPAL